MKNNKYDFLRHNGLSNSDATRYSDMVTEIRVRDNKATYCSSLDCAGKTNKNKGTLVSLGTEFKDYCPKCGSKHGLYYEQLSPAKMAGAKKFMEANQ
jgi:hypothetical protein